LLGLALMATTACGSPQPDSLAPSLRRTALIQGALGNFPSQDHLDEPTLRAWAQRWQTELEHYTEDATERDDVRRELIARLQEQLGTDQIQSAQLPAGCATFCISDATCQQTIYWPFCLLVTCVGF